MSNEKMSFEERIKRLEQIVRTMERGDASLEEALNLFQEGTNLVKECGAMLDDAEMQVKMIIPDSNGKPAEEDFVDE